MQKERRDVLTVTLWRLHALPVHTVCYWLSEPPAGSGEGSAPSPFGPQRVHGWLRSLLLPPTQTHMRTHTQAKVNSLLSLKLHQLNKCISTKPT